MLAVGNEVRINTTGKRAIIEETNGHACKIQKRWVHSDDVETISQKPPPTQTGRSVLYMVRHGEARHNLVDHGPDCFAIRRDTTLVDPPLTEVGENQARHAGVILEGLFKEHGDRRPDVVVSSTLRRALQTAELAALPLGAPGVSLLALDAAVEIQFDDIWNEPRSTEVVKADFPKWKIEASHFCKNGGARLIETADSMIERAEATWKLLEELRAPVIILVAHGCFLYFFQRRLEMTTGELCQEQRWANGEVRRCLLPPADGQHMQWSQVSTRCNAGNVNFWNLFGKRAAVINEARRSGAGRDPAWALKEWRNADDLDEDLDAKL